MTAFLRESPLRQARRIAEAEIRNIATAAEIQWLYDNQLLWLRALVRIMFDVENTIAKSKLDLVALKPAAGTHPSSEYLRSKNEVDLKTQGRLHFKGLVRRRIEEVKAMLGSGPIDHLMVGDLIDVFLRISNDADAGELESAADQALFWAKKLAGKT